MGGTFSEPVPAHVNTDGFVCMVIRSYDKLRLLHAPNEVVFMVRKIIRELSDDDNSENKYGSIQFRLPGSPFMVRTGKESATIGKVMAIRIFEEMHSMGYDLVASSDLSRAFDQSSWFFRRVCAERPKRTVMCLAPGSSDKLIVVRGNDVIIRVIRDMIKKVWALGLQDEQTERVGRDEQIHEFKLRGNPWYSEGEESTLCRQFLLAVIATLQTYGWFLLATTNLKGGTDSMFFAQDTTSPDTLATPHLGMVSFNRSDRVRLINFDESIKDCIRSTILKFYQTKPPDERDYFGAHEFKLKGYPFACSGDEAVATRQLICRILEALRERGWDCLTTMDISRKMTDKSVLIFHKVQISTSPIKYACVALSDVNRIRLVNFPNQVSKNLQSVISDRYMPGISSEGARDGACYEIDLNGVPWTQNSSYNLHARSMLTCLLAFSYRNGWRLVASADVSAKFVHQENGPDYPIDVHSLFFAFEGPSQDQLDGPTVNFAELRVSDLESLDAAAGYSTPPPTYEQAMRRN